MDKWERKLATRDTNRVVRNFEWGTDWLEPIGVAGAHLNGSPADYLQSFVKSAVADSDRFYSYETPADFQLEQGRLSFTSPVRSPYPENNTVEARWFPAPDDHGRALVVLPQWNADAGGHVGLAKLLNKFGISALRMTMAYHADRMPGELSRADYHMSANIGRTIHAFRQSVLDARCCLDWLAAQGCRKLGILGTSLGSCVAFITAAHDSRIQVGIFNHVSMNVADVVWTGLSTQHVRKGFGDVVGHEDLCRYWSVISPVAYIDRMEDRSLRSLLIWARHDSTFLPVYSQKVLSNFRERKLTHEVFTLPCGHYTTGQFPFNLMDGLAMCRFAARNL
jgi:hypothetical protein